jgi:glycosyltransferase involved in cell wall biosynthesis
MTPDYGFGQLARSYRAARRTDVSRFDQVISLRYPSFAVAHARQTCWLNHTMREYYDLWPRFAASISWRNRIKESIRRSLLHAADGHLLHHVTRVLAQSKTIQARVDSYFGIRTDVVYPPAPFAGYRCEQYGDYIFAVSRLDPLKRMDLLIRAMAELPARQVRAVIAGDGEQGADLRALAIELGVADRISFVGRVDDETTLRHYARCRAVCFTPYAEDYGFVTIEAFASGKGVITCCDSGGPAELVDDDVSGAVCDPTPASIAIALARLADDRVLAERFGAAAAARAATITWHDAVTRLLL